MKIAINVTPLDGPWGGGNRFVKSLAAAAKAHGHTVAHALDADTDIALMIDPRARNPQLTFGPGAILRHLAWRNPRTVVIHRINECDERKNTRGMNARLVRANHAADVTVFVGTWMTRLPVWRRNLREPWLTILNGADTDVFNARGFRRWTGEGPLSIVTHHWGNHLMKGFDVYRRIDDLLDDPAWRARLAFTYVGKVPAGFVFRNARYVAPLDGTALADELRTHHAYVTASINEPGGNHQNEGALCGLPLLYRESGCMPEYCEGFGVSYAGPQDVEDALGRLMARYDALAAIMPAYPHTAARMTAEWLALFDRLAEERDAIVARRRLWRNPLTLLANQVPL